MLWGGRNTANICHWHVWGVLTVSRPHWVCPHSRRVCFPSLHCSGSRLLCQELSEADPGLHAFPSSTPLRFRFSGTPQRCRLTWWGLHFVPFPGPSCSGDQVLGKHSRPQVGAVTYRLPHPCCSAFWVHNRRGFSGMPCVSSGELISGCDPPG